MGPAGNHFISDFESFGVSIRLEVDDLQRLDGILKRLSLVFGELITASGAEKDSILLRVTQVEEDSFRVTDSTGEPDRFYASADLIEGVESIVRIKVGEYARNHVFVHAGAVALNGRALILPGRTHSGKSTLVSALVRNGAEYLSDEYAVIDSDGKVLPFPKPISMRRPELGSHQVDVFPSELGGSVCRGPVECGMILFTEFRNGSTLTPKVISRARGIMRVLEHTVTIRRNPAYSLKVLNKLILRAIIAQSYRPDASEVAILLTNYFNGEVISTP